MKKLFTLIAVAVMAFAAQANVLSVCQGEYYSGSVPVYGLWYDTPGQTQQIYPADMLAEMAGGEITEISFLTLSCLDGSPYGQDFSSYTVKMEDGTITLALMEVNEDGFTEAVAMTGAEVVATTTPEYGAPALTFVLDQPFAYNGGNLLVEVTVTEPGGYGTTYFWGTGFYDDDDNPIYYPTYTANENYAGDLNTSLAAFLAAANFVYEPGTEPGPGPEPTEMTAAPVFNGYTTDGIHAYFVEIMETEPSTIYYRVFVWDADNNEWVVYGEEDWTEYTEILSFAGDGKYRVEAYAVAENKLPSYDIAYEFTVSPLTGLSELTNGKTVSSVRYFNAAGQEMSEANGLTIVVATYTDGTTSTAKVVK